MTSFWRQPLTLFILGHLSIDLNVLRTKKESKSDIWGRFRKLYFGSLDKKQNPTMGVASESRILTFGMTKLDNGGRFPRYYFGCWDDKTQKMEANLSLSALLSACLLCSEPVCSALSLSALL